MLSPEDMCRRREEAAATVREAHFEARLLTVKAVAKLNELMEHGTPQLQFASACAVLDRGLGRPAQAMAIEVLFQKKFTSMTTDELRQFREMYAGTLTPALLPPIIEAEGT